MNRTTKALRSAIAAVLCISLSVPLSAPVLASTGAPALPPQATTTVAPAASFSQQELDQLLAPIALYPDELLAHVLMASTYPLEIILADRWAKANPGLKGKALEDALQKQSWDPAVKALTVFPQVLAMMSEQIGWTHKLGDAFLAQPKNVMDTAQALRAKAVETGALKDTEQQKVVREVQNTTTIIKIEPTNPEVVYVPTYNPSVVYGAWPYPAYPPYYWYPPGYYYPYGGALLGFTAGVIIGGALWGNCNWGGGGVHIDHHSYNNFNRTSIKGDNNWRHQVDHRGSLPYRDKSVADRYGNGRGKETAARDASRGRTHAARPSTQRGDSSARNPGNRGSGGRDVQVGSRDLGGGSPLRGGKDAAGARDFGSGGRNLGGLTSTRFDRADSSPGQSFSNRGSSGFDSARSAGNFGGGARAGGGFGGGGFGGGRGGGGRR
jgi:hypothetical protein